MFADGQKATVGPITTSLKTKQTITKLRKRYEVIEDRSLSDTEITRRALAIGLRMMIRELKGEGAEGTRNSGTDN